MKTLTFQNITLSPVKQDAQIWLSSSELAKALGYAEADSVTKIYNRNIDEFSPNMTQVIDISETVNLTAPKKQQNLVKKVRIFSLRGCHLIAMFARTKVAKDFRKWVLDILDKEVGEPVITPIKTTKSDRKPLVQAVNMLCVKSGLHQKEVWTMVHQYMGVDSIEDITLQDIPKAVEYVHRLICDLSKLDEEQLLYNEMWRQMGIMRQIEVRKELEQLKSEMHQLFKRLETATKLNSIIYDAFVQPIRPTLTQEQRDIAIQRAIEGLERSRLLLHLV